MNFSISLAFFFCLTLMTSAQAESRKIVILETMPIPVIKEHSKAIKQSLAELEAKTGDTYEIEILEGMGAKDRAVKLLKKSLEKKRPDLVVTIATLATQAAKEVLSGSNIPILFCVVIDPIGAGIIKKVGVASGTNITGVVYTQQHNTKVEMVMRLLRHTHRDSVLKIGFIGSDYPSSISDLRTLEKISARADDFEFVTYIYPYRPIPEGLPEMFANMRKGIDSIKDKVDFFWEGSGPMSEIVEASQILIDSGKPVILGYTPKAVEMGILMAVVTDYQETGRQVVEMADKVFQGTDVGTIPVTTPRKFNLYLNMKTAEKYGLKIPSHLLMIAGENIFP
jgi:putative ABC transport system substrate-binding protein